MPAPTHCTPAAPARGPVLCRLSEIPDGDARGVGLGPGIDKLEVILVRRGTRVFGYVNSCPHTGVALDWTPHQFLDAEGLHIQCATHGALFRIEDGACVYGPCNGRGLTPLPVVVVDGLIRLAESTD